MSAGQENRYDLTQGNIINKLLLVALPIIGTQFIQMSYNLTDMFLLGRVGSDAVAASGTAGMYLWLSNGLLMIGRMGAEIGVSQNLGRRDLRAARKYAQNSMFLALILGLFLLVVYMAFSKSLIGFFNIREIHVAHDARIYLMITAMAIPATFLSGVVAGTFNASGNSRVPLLINACGLGLNIILDPVFIFALGLGVKGAAIATLIAQMVVCSLSLLALIKRKDRPFDKFLFFSKPEKRRLIQILRWSIPIGAESMLFTFLTMFISRFVSAYGAEAIAVYRVGNQVESLSWLIGVGFSTAVTAFVGQNFGAGKWNRIRQGSRTSFLLLSGWGMLVTLVLFFLGGIIFRLFLPEEELVDMGRTFLKILAMCQIISCLEAVSAGAFRGLGKTVPPFITSFTTNALRIPLAYILSTHGMGLNGIWLSITIGASARGLWLFFWYQRELRRRPQIDIEPVPEPES